MYAIRSYYVSGREIPLGARIIAVADTYDAITTKRTYKEASTHHEALREIERCRTHQLCPEVVDVFLSHHEEIREMLQRVEKEIALFKNGTTCPTL